LAPCFCPAPWLVGFFALVEFFANTAPQPGRKRPAAIYYDHAPAGPTAAGILAKFVAMSRDSRGSNFGRDYWDACTTFSTKSRCCSLVSLSRSRSFSTSFHALYRSISIFSSAVGLGFL